MKKFILPTFIFAVLFLIVKMRYSLPSPPKRFVNIFPTSVSQRNGYPQLYTSITEHEILPSDVSGGFVMSAIQDSNGWSRVCNVVVSNLSDSALMMYGGDQTLWFQVEYLTNRTWEEYSTRTIDGGPGIFAPHVVISNNLFEIPNGATAIKVGLSFTSLSWRTSLAMRYHLPQFMRSFFFKQDVKKRTQTEWSNVYPLESNSFSLRSSTP